MKPVLMLSGGVDSVVSWFYLGKPESVHITGHSRYSKKELECVHRLKHVLGELVVHIVELPFVLPHEREDAWIPARNLLFSLVGAYFGDIIYIACQRGERDIVDRSDEFFETTSELLTKHFGTTKRVHPVWVNETKQDLLKWYIDNVGDMELLKHYTVSCYDGKHGGRCGDCASCFRLAVSLVYNNVEDWEEWFEVNPFTTPTAQQYITKVLSGKYEKRRTEQTLQVLKQLGLV